MSGVQLEDHPFWDYALSVYGADGVSAACIALQDRHGIDVNLLLVSLWAAADGREPLTPRQFDALLEVSESWNREIVCEIRALRMRLSSGYGAVGDARRSAIRNAALTLEIDCEHVEMLALADALGGPVSQPVETEAAREVAVSNLKAYFARKAVAAEAEDFAFLATIVAGGWPGTEAAEIRRLWD